MSRLVVTDEAEHQLGGAVPTPAAAFLIAMLTLPVLFWLVMLKRTTVSTAPEEWLMGDVLPAIHTWIQVNLPPVEALIVAISGLGQRLVRSPRLRDSRPASPCHAAVATSRCCSPSGTLAFPMEWALKYFVSPEAVTIQQLVSAIFDVDGIGLDDIADFPAGHALRATVLYGLVAFCIARLSHDVRQGYTAYVVAAVVVGAISATRIYLGAHFPIDVLGGWMAGVARCWPSSWRSTSSASTRRRGPGASPRAAASRAGWPFR